VGSRFSRLGRLTVLGWRPFHCQLQAMPIYSGAVIATGAALIVLAMIPLSWLEIVARWLNPDRRR